MLVWRGKFPSSSPPLSLRTFLEQVTSTVSIRFRPHRIATQTLTAASSVNSSCFETLNPLQKQQISLYVDTLLQWNQVFSLFSWFPESCIVLVFGTTVEINEWN